MNEEVKSPKILTRLLKWYCKIQLIESIQGDLEEQFEEDVDKYGLTKAKRRFCWNVIRFFRPGIIKPFIRTQKFNNYGMFRNYFITSIRFIRREKMFALMNIIGLAMGIGCGLIIYKIIDHETSFDTHHSQYNSIYRVINEFQFAEGAYYNAGQPHPLGEGLRKDFPGIVTSMAFYEREGLITVENDAGTKKRFQEKDGISFVEPDFFKLFDFEWIAGSPNDALAEKGQVVLTQSKVEKYFGLDENSLEEAMGKSLMLENSRTVFVTGVIRDLPSTTDLPFDVMFNYYDQDVANPYFYKGKDWSEYNSGINCFLLLDSRNDANEMETGLKGYLKKYQREETASRRELKLQPLSELHSSEIVVNNYKGATVSNNKLIVLGIVGLFLIITACINFINLATAQAVKRSKEVGVRKSLGSSKGQLIAQFLSETFIITFIAALAGLLVAQLLSTEIENIFGYEINLQLFSDLTTIGMLLIIIVGVTIISGLYPSFILARMNPILAVKNSLNTRQTSGLLSLRRGLVVFQFAISQILIIGILVLNMQMDYFLNKDLGFNKDSIIVVKLPDSDSLKLEVLRNKLLANSQIEKVSFSTTGPLATWNVSNPIFHPSIVEEDPSGNLKTVDENYLDLYELELIAGENFKRGDSRNFVVVNRKLTRLIGFDDPAAAVGEQFTYGRGGRKFTIVGVVEDFHSRSLRTEMDYVIFANLKWNIYQAGIKFNTGQTGYSDLKNLIESVESEWQATYPEYVFDFEFYDEQLAGLYKIEKQVSEVFRIIVAMAIIIGCLGLYGLISFMSNQKTKEIGIRKVMGASILSIWNIFSKEMIILLVVAFFIAAPVSWYAMNSWLNNYEYRVELTPAVFLVSILISLLIALVTISYKSIRASKANPILSLRDE